MEDNKFDLELQKYIKSIVEIVWDYIYNFNDIDGMYIYMLLGRVQSSNIFYMYNGIPYKKHKIFNIKSDFIVTDAKQQLLNKQTLDQIEKIETLFKQYEREVPFEIKIIYSPKTTNLDVKFSYENPFKNGDKSSIDDGFIAWTNSLGIQL